MATFTSLSVVAGDGQATVSWVYTGSTTHLFQVFVGTNPDGSTQAPVNGATGPATLTSPYVINGLTNGQTYYVSIKAYQSMKIGFLVVNDSKNEGPLPEVTPTAPAPPSGGVPCFPAGVKIRTPHGETAVESLKTGDLVLTAAGRAVPIRMHSYSLEETTPTTAPYFIPAGALGPKAPIKSLHLSPLHAFQVRPNVWWCAKEAAKHSLKIQQYGLGEPITYYHVECPNFLRDNLVADGVVVESFAANQLTQAQKHNLYKFSKALGGFVRSNSASVVKV